MTNNLLNKNEALKNTDFHKNLHTKAEKFLKQKQYKSAVVPYLNSMLLNKKNIKTYIGISKAYKDRKSTRLNSSH